jgi:hypothetical protein
MDAGRLKTAQISLGKLKNAREAIAIASGDAPSGGQRQHLGRNRCCARQPPGIGADLRGHSRDNTRSSVRHWPGLNAFS